MNGKELKNEIPKWAAKVGARKARLALLNAGIGYTTAVLLIKGEYPSTPTGDTVDRLRAALRAS